MLYHPSDREIQRLPREIKRMLSVPALNVRETVPIKSEEQARQYLLAKVRKYKESLQYKGSDRVIVDKYIAATMNKLLAVGFTYVNLYAKDCVFLTEPHIASALAFNYLNHIEDNPDSIDLSYGLTYEVK